MAYIHRHKLRTFRESEKYTTRMASDSRRNQCDDAYSTTALANGVYLHNTDDGNSEGLTAPLFNSLNEDLAYE